MLNLSPPFVAEALMVKTIKSDATYRKSHATGAYPCFCSVKQLRVLLLSHGWDSGYPQLVPMYRPQGRWRKTIWSKITEIQRADHYNTPTQASVEVRGGGGGGGSKIVDSGNLDTSNNTE